MPNYYLGLRKIVVKLLFRLCENSAKLVFGLLEIIAKLLFGFYENSCQIIIWVLWKWFWDFVKYCHVATGLVNGAM